jgi:hypothetical protein
MDLCNAWFSTSKRILGLNMKETNVNLNVQEIGIILSAIQNLENIDEIHIAREYGSASALYNKLYTVWERMDRSETGLRYDVVPSF